MEDTYFMDEALALAREAAADGEVLYQDGERITTETSLDLYAVWADAYTVTFDNDGATATVMTPRNGAIGSRSQQEGLPLRRLVQRRDEADGGNGHLRR